MALKIIILQYLVRARFLKSFNLKDAFLISGQSRTLAWIPKLKFKS